MDAEKVANGLGWFSLGLGLTEVVAPEWLGGILGLEDRAGMIRLYGLRELSAGIGILPRPRPVGWLWARVGGDALDLSTLVPALKEENPKKGAAGVAFGMVVAITVLDIVCALKLGEGD